MRHALRDSAIVSLTPADAPDERWYIDARGVVIVERHPKGGSLVYATFASRTFYAPLMFSDGSMGQLLDEPNDLWRRVMIAAAGEPVLTTDLYSQPRQEAA